MSERVIRALEKEVDKLNERITRLETQLIEVERARNIEQGAWEEVKEYQDENKRLKERIKELKDGLILIRKSTEIMEARRFAEQALEGK